MLTHRAILEAAAARPDRDALRFLASGEAVTERRSYAELVQAAEARARQFVGAGLSGAALALVLEPGALFVETLLACLMAGVVVAPLAPPHQPIAALRLKGALADLRPRAIATSADLAAKLATPDLPVLTLETWEGPSAPLPRIDPSAPAIVQYSSGSTAAPRGIVLTQANVAANLQMMAATMEVADNVSVAWLPHSHDMGLFGTILEPLYTGGTSVLMPPQAFLRRPARWLRAMAAHGGTHSTAPNFGYALAARRADPAEMAVLDLRAWRIACIGAEPTLPATLAAFAAATAPAGFDPRAFRSCYGLAEAVLLVSSGPPRILGDRVTCGRAAPGSHLALRPAPEAPEGAQELLIAGDHVSPGVWAPDLPGGIAPHPGAESLGGQSFVPTGDLVRLEGGEVLVMDRLKDILPLRGGSLGPTEVEARALGLDLGIEAVAAVPGGRPGTDAVGLAVELRDRRMAPEAREALARRLAEDLARAFGIQARVRLFGPWDLPRTTSGKIRRFAVRALMAEEAP